MKKKMMTFKLIGCHLVVLRVDTALWEMEFMVNIHQLVKVQYSSACSHTYSNSMH